MLRYDRQTKPGLTNVRQDLCDIRPGNGAGQFLQPQSPHGALSHKKQKLNSCICQRYWSPQAGCQDIHQL